MSTNALSVQPPMMSALGKKLAHGLFLLGNVVISGGALFFSYNLAAAIFFATTFLYIGIKIKKTQGKGLWLLIWLHILFLFFIFNGIYEYFLTNPAPQELANTNDLAFMLWGEQLSALITALLAAMLSVLGLLAIVATFVGVVAYVLRQWAAPDAVSFWQTWLYVYRTLFWGSAWWVEIVDGEPKGHPDATNFLNQFGGPGWLVIHPGQVVVLHRQGQFTRSVGAGSVWLGWGEKIRRVVSLGTKGDEHTIKNVLTRDRIHLNVTVGFSARIETEEESRQRFQSTVNKVAATLETLTTAGATAEELLPAQRELDRAEHRLAGIRLEDDNQRYYESVIRGIPVGGPNGVWEAARGTVESTLRDVLMSELSEKLFDVSGVTLAGRLAERNIKKIEDFVLEKCRESLTERGIVLVGIDITQVDFPPEIQEKLKYEVNEQIEARVKKEQAETKKALAKAEAECRVTRAEAENDSANHLAKAMKIFTEAKANHYQRIIEVLQAYKLSESAQAEVVKSIAASSATGDDLQNTMKLAAQFAKGQEPPDTPPRP